MKDGPAFRRKRILKTAIPYVLWTVIYTLAYRQPDRLLFNLITTRAAGPFYYIFVYIQFVLLTPLLGWLADSRWRWTGWLVMPLTTVVFTYLPLVTGAPLHPYVSLVSDVCCLCWFSFYYLGLLLGNDKLEIRISTRTLAMMLVLSLVLQIAEGYWWHCLGSANAGTQTKMTAFVSNTLILLLVWRYLKNNRYTGISGWRCSWETAPLVSTCPTFW